MHWINRLLLSRLLLLFMLLLMLFGPANTYALSNEVRSLFNNDIFYYDAGEEYCSEQSGGYVPSETTSDTVVGEIKGIYKSGVKDPYILEQFMIHILKRLAQINNKPETDYLTKDHVVALVAFAVGEGGDIMNKSVFNPMNYGGDPKAILGVDYSQGVWGGTGSDGRRAYPSFDIGIEMYARQFSKGKQSRLNKVLSQKDSTAKDFMYALTYYKEYPGNDFWASASLPPKDQSYYKERLNLVKQVENNYPAYAGLAIGTPKFEQKEQIYHKDLITYKDVSASETTPAGTITNEGLEVLDSYKLPAYKGTTGREEEINTEGRVKSMWDKPGNDGYVTWSGLLKKLPVQDRQNYMDYYITMRWNYAAWNWNGTTPKKDIDEKQYSWFAKKPRMVIVTNPKTQKSIIAPALEAGPGPWVGVDNSSNNTPKQGWTNPYRGTPSEYKGIVSGFPPKAYSALGLNSDDGGYPTEKKVELEYKWAKNQEASPGPTDYSSNVVSGHNCSDKTGVGDSGGSAGQNMSKEEVLAQCKNNTASGITKIVCGTTELNGLPYAYGGFWITKENYNKRPPELGCNSYANMAIARATNGAYLEKGDYNYCSGGYLREGVPDGKFKKISKTEVVPGDLLIHDRLSGSCGGSSGAGHVEIVVSYDNNTNKVITTGSGHPSGVKDSRGIDDGYWDYGIRYIGGGL